MIRVRLQQKKNCFFCLSNIHRSHSPPGRPLAPLARNGGHWRLRRRVGRSRARPRAIDLALQRLRAANFACAAHLQLLALFAALVGTALARGRPVTVLAICRFKISDNIKPLQITTQTISQNSPFGHAKPKHGSCFIVGSVQTLLDATRVKFCVPVLLQAAEHSPNAAHAPIVH